MFNNITLDDLSTVTGGTAKLDCQPPPPGHQPPCHKPAPTHQPTGWPFGGDWGNWASLFRRGSWGSWPFGRIDGGSQ
jgi:hypothetical protein